MKKAVILHGTSAEPMSGWRPWLKRKLEEQGYEVWVPSLPDNDTPNKQKYNDFLFSAGWDFTDNIIIGHSSGAVQVLNLLMDERCSKVKLAVSVSTWNGVLIDETPEMTTQFAGLFPAEGFDFLKIKSNADSIVFVHNEFDPYCSPQDAKYLSEKLGAELMMLHKDEGGNANHLGSPIIELPELLDLIAKRAG